MTFQPQKRLVETALSWLTESAGLTSPEGLVRAQTEFCRLGAKCCRERIYVNFDCHHALVCQLPSCVANVLFAGELF